LGGSTLTTPTGTWTSTSSNSTRTNQSVLHPNPNPKNHHHQLKLYGNAIIPEATQQMHIAIAAFIHGRALSFSMARNPNFLNIIQIARNLGPRYSPPDRRSVSGHLLNSLHNESFKEMMRTLLSEVDIFGLTFYGDGATIKSVPLINILAAGPNNPFALLDIVDCTTHLQSEGKKDALYISSMILPLIQRMDNTRDVHKKKHTGIVDLVLMDGASNVQKDARMLAVHYPCITVGHCAAHLVSLFFKDVYTHASNYVCLSCVHVLYVLRCCLQSHLVHVAVSSLYKFVSICQAVEEHIWFLPSCAPCNLQEVHRASQSWLAPWVY
jgi:hypothetical protein